MDRFFEYINIKLWLCIVGIAVISCLVAVFTDFMAIYLFQSKLLS